MFRTVKKRAAAVVGLAVTAATLGLAGTAHASYQDSHNWLCRGAYEIAYGYKVDPCIGYRSSDDRTFGMKVNVTGSPTTDVRLYAQLMDANTGETFCTDSMIAASTGSFHFNDCTPSGKRTLVVKTWLTESGVPYGDVESPKMLNYCPTASCIVLPPITGL